MAEKEETKSEIVEDIEKSGVSEEVAKKEEALDEKAQIKSEKSKLKKKSKKMEDEYAEVPEDVLDEEDLEELKEMESGKEKSEKEEISEEVKRKMSFAERRKYEEVQALRKWDPKTELGKEVKDGKIKNVDEILDNDRKILEPEIVDSLIKIRSDLISIGQSKGKFGGGKRRAWRQTQRKTKQQNVATFSSMAVVGDENGHVGIGVGRAKETLPARDKATRKAKLNIFKVRRTCAAFDCACSEPHTIPFEVSGKAGSVRVTFIPAPQGTGLVVADQLKKILSFAGIKDIYSKTFGKKRTTFNLVKACIDALKKTNMEAGNDRFSL